MAAESKNLIIKLAVSAVEIGVGVVGALVVSYGSKEINPFISTPLTLACLASVARGFMLAFDIGFDTHDSLEKNFKP